MDWPFCPGTESDWGVSRAVLRSKDFFSATGCRGTPQGRSPDRHRQSPHLGLEPAEPIAVEKRAGIEAFGVHSRRAIAAVAGNRGHMPHLPCDPSAPQRRGGSGVAPQQAAWSVLTDTPDLAPRTIRPGGFVPTSHVGGSGTGARGIDCDGGTRMKSAILPAQSTGNVPLQSRRRALKLLLLHEPPADLPARSAMDIAVQFSARMPGRVQKSCNPS